MIKSPDFGRRGSRFIFEITLTPREGGVAALTLGAEGSLVGVDVAVATFVVRKGCPGVLFVAALALNLFVGTGERKLRFACVIKSKLRFNFWPRHRGMALGAILKRAIFRFVNISVARNTFGAVF